MRKQIVAGNWKMNNDTLETAALLDALNAAALPEDVRVMVAPAFTQLTQAKTLTENTAIEVAAQNMNAAASGAYTGEIPAKMLLGIDIQTVILGHSERRAYYNETDASLVEKVTTAIENGLEIIFCFGEELQERKDNVHFDVIERQLRVALFDLPASAWKNIILAYEPVWAIGTGETASPEQAQEIHAFIRQLIAKQYDAAIAENTSILYGGSVKPNNATEIFSMQDVDGGLIGGAALNADDFLKIVMAF